MSNTPTVAALLREAAKADSGADVARLVGEAERLRHEGQLSHEASRQLDLAGTEVRDRLTPSPVHELHTAATDWVGEMETGGGEGARQHMIAAAHEWYGDLHEAVRAEAGEFRIQAEGMADRESGAFGEVADQARQTFLSMAATLRQRDVRRGVVKEAEIVGDTGQTGQGAADVLGENPPTGEGYQGLPGATTDSNRAPAFQDMGTSPNDPGEGTGNGIADAGNGLAGEERTPSPNPYQAARTANGGSMPHFAEVDREKYEQNKSDAEKRRAWQDRKGTGKGPDKGRAKNKNGESDSDKPDWLEEKLEDKEGSMGHIARCPSCQGFGAVATTEPGRQRIAQLKRQGYSGLHQLDEIANPKDDPDQTPYPTQQAFPMEEGGWANGPGQVQNEISQAESQIAEREQRKGASLQARAEWAAREAYRQVVAAGRPRDPWSMFSTAGQDDSGWLGDMGAGGVTPGEQDGGNPGGGDNLSYTDPVYGQGGDQAPGPRQQVGSDERNDRTNEPDAWAPGQPTQMDQAARGEQLPPTGAPGFPDDGAGYGNQGGNQFQNGGGSKTGSIDADPEIVRAQQFIRARIAKLQGA